MDLVFEVPVCQNMYRFLHSPELALRVALLLRCLQLEPKFPSPPKMGMRPVRGSSSDATKYVSKCGPVTFDC